MILASQNATAVKRPLLNRRQKHFVGNFFTYIALLIFVFIVDLPLIAMAGTAMKKENVALSSTSLLPKAGEWSFEAFGKVFTTTDFGRNLINSGIVSVCTTIGCILFASMAGYALSRYRGKFFSGYSVLLLMLQMFPQMLLLIPMFILYTKLGLMNTLYSVVISYTTMNLAFNIMMIQGFFDTIPRELEEAGKVDGCTGFQAYYRIILPISLPGIATVAIFTFLNAWNEFTFASLMLRKTELQTLTVGLTKFVQQYTTDWSKLMAASTIATVPALIFLVFTQKYLIQGLTAGAVKG